MQEIDLIRQNVSRAIFHVGLKWRHVVQQSLSGAGLTEPEMSALYFIGRLGEGCNQIALAEEIGIEGSSLVRLLDQLANAGLIRREKSPSDRRSNTLWYTEAGSALRADVEAMLIALRAQVFADIGKHELEATLKVFDAVEKAFKTPAED